MRRFELFEKGPFLNVFFFVFLADVSILTLQVLYFKYNKNENLILFLVPDPKGAPPPILLCVTLYLLITSKISPKSVKTGTWRVNWLPLKSKNQKISSKKQGVQREKQKMHNYLKKRKRMKGEPPQHYQPLFRCKFIQFPGGLLLNC